MHTSFTGTARKPRQVNLSGRHVANPFASLSGSVRPSPSAGTQNAVATAQAERARRQQEKTRDVAVRKIQRTWRGHRSRRIQKQKGREEWDHRERMRLGAEWGLDYDTLEGQKYARIPYESAGQCLAQMRLLNRFCEVGNQSDRLRLLFFGEALQTSSVRIRITLSDPTWITSLRRYSCSIIQCIAQAVTSVSDSDSSNTLARALQLAKFLTRFNPHMVDEEPLQFFNALCQALLVSEKSQSTESLVASCILTILSTPTSTEKRIQMFHNFASILLRNDRLSEVSEVIDFLRQPSMLQTLAQAVLLTPQSSGKENASHDQEANRDLWQLAYLLFLHHQTSADNSTFEVWIQAVSVLLNRCANDVATRLDVLDSPMNGTSGQDSSPLNPFVRENVVSMAQQGQVEAIVRQLRRAGGDRDVTVSKMAKPLANYAVAILRAFPTKATNIRMWLYRSSPPSAGSSSTIQYLWRAAYSTSVFQRISKDYRNAVSVLTEAAPQHNQIGRAPVSADDTVQWQEEWRILLLFLELYSFILKIMDDEEFFALDETAALTSQGRSATQFTQGALSLKDVAKLTDFLKNLAFSLYWHTNELADSNEVEDVGGISAFFEKGDSQPVRPAEKKIQQTLTGNGVSQAYLKGIVTALLRMLHERDSRRKFLPENHWLMTSQLDMAGFIPQVVAEEEKRNQLDDDDDTDEEEEEVIDSLEVDDQRAALQTFSSMFGIRPPHMARNAASRYNDSMLKARERARKRRQAESLVPRLEMLRNLPFFIPFDTRVQIFREFVFRDQIRRRNGLVNPDEWRTAVAHGSQARGWDGRPRGMESVGRHHANIHRESVFEDAFNSFYELGEELKEPIQISFIDQFGAPEAGIDGGGVTKEFLMSVTGEAFDPRTEPALFVENDQRYLYPNPNVTEYHIELLRRMGIRSGSEQYTETMRDLMRRYEFIGRIVGKCMYEGILIDVSFAGFFLLKWALTGGTTSATRETSYRASLNDFKEFDSQMYQSLLQLKNWNGDVEGDLGINFEVTDEMTMPDGTLYRHSKDLIPNGRNVPVDNYNRVAYIDRITRYRLQQQPSHVTNAFLRGLGQIVQPMWLAMFNQRELQKLVGGDNAELDINDLRRNTQYGGLYVIGDDGLEHPTIALFWKVLREMDDEDRRKVLKFVTSTPRAPLLGFSHLNPNFSIRDSSEDQTRLPSTSTCVNLLKLPRYGDEVTMREKLMYAINSGAGFDLS